MNQRPIHVLFLCTGNSARSILAEAILNKLGGERFRGFSAGSFPKGEVDAYAARELQMIGADPAAFRSKSWNEFAGPDAPPMDFVITVCDQAGGEACPTWPGHPISAQWSIQDPASVEGDDATKRAAFSRVAHQLHTRINLLLSLRHEALDRMALEHAVRALA